MKNDHIRPVLKKKLPRGGQPFVPSDEQRAAVRLMAGFGIPIERMVYGVINPKTKKPINKGTLSAAFAEEIAIGSIEMDKVAMESLASQMRQGNVTSIIWYMKNKMGWRDHQEITSHIDSEVEITARDRIARKLDTLAERIAGQANGIAAAAGAKKATADVE